MEHVPGGSRRNLEDVSGDVDFGDLDELEKLILADAQTSGGLLMSVSAEVVDGLLVDLADRGVPAVVVGEVVEGPAGRIELSG